MVKKGTATLAVSAWRSSSSTPDFLWISPHPISQAELIYPMEEESCQILLVAISTRNHYLMLMAIGEGWDINQLENQELCLLTRLPLHHKGSVRAHITADAELNWLQTNSMNAEGHKLMKPNRATSSAKLCSVSYCLRTTWGTWSLTFSETTKSS